MARRFAVVIWWVGTIFVLCAAVGALVALFGDEALKTIADASFFLLPAAACWALAFVLGGSFWRPPHAN